MSDHTKPAVYRTAVPERLTGKIVVMEAPSVIRELNSLAHDHGCSLGVEVRMAVRAHLDRERTK